MAHMVVGVTLNVGVTSGLTVIVNVCGVPTQVGDEPISTYAVTAPIARNSANIITQSNGAI